MPGGESLPSSIRSTHIAVERFLEGLGDCPPEIRALVLCARASPYLDSSFSNLACEVGAKDRAGSPTG